LQLQKVRLDFVQIALAQRSRVRQQLRVLLQAAKEGCLLKGEIELRPIQDVEDDDFVALVPQVLQARQQLRDVIKQVAENDHQRAPRNAFGQVVKDGCQACVFAGHILAVLGKLDREAVIRTLVHAREIALDDEPSLEFQAADLRQDQGIEIALWIVHLI